METILLNGKEFTLPKDEAAYQQTVRSYVWCTYRNYFDAIGASFYCTDAGWGCMLRCGQMVLARALTVSRLGKDWQLAANGPGHDVYSKIVSSFFDLASAPYSIHNIAERGEKLDKRVGQWFGPNTIAQVLKNLVNEQATDLFVHTAMDGVLMKNLAADEYAAASKTRKCALLVLVPVRLGLQHSINTVYLPALKALFSIPQALGIIGGKPNAAHYFVGVQGSSVLYLDPHTVQDAATQFTNESFGSFQCKALSKLSMSEVDPSMCAAFICTSQSDFDDLCNAIKKMNKAHTYGLFDVADSKSVAALNVDGLDVGSDEDDDMVLL